MRVITVRGADTTQHHFFRHEPYLRRRAIRRDKCNASSLRFGALKARIFASPARRFHISGANINGLTQRGTETVIVRTGLRERVGNTQLIGTQQAEAEGRSSTYPTARVDSGMCYRRVSREIPHSGRDLRARRSWLATPSHPGREPCQTES